MYREITQGIQIDVEPAFAPEHSSVQEERWVFTYRITLTNQGEREVQLLNRHWIITDGLGKVHEVNGPGVVGEQPVLAPGATYSYSSFCPLTTPTGNMRGAYEMVVRETGERFQAKVPLFFLRDLRQFN